MTMQSAVVKFDVVGVDEVEDELECVCRSLKVVARFVDALLDAGDVSDKQLESRLWKRFNLTPAACRKVVPYLRATHAQRKAQPLQSKQVEPPLFHFCPVDVDGLPIERRDGRPVRVGETLTVDGDAVMHENGLDAAPTLLDALASARWPSALALVTLSGDIDDDGRKYCGTQRTCLALVDAAETSRRLLAFGRWCLLEAADALNLPPDVRAFLVTGEGGVEAVATLKAQSNYASWTVLNMVAPDSDSRPIFEVAANARHAIGLTAGAHAPTPAGESQAEWRSRWNVAFAAAEGAAQKAQEAKLRSLFPELEAA